VPGSTDQRGRTELTHRTRCDAVVGRIRHKRFAARPRPKNENLALSEHHESGILRPLGVFGMFPLAPHGAAE
jgi:hypothetical protein